MFNSITDTVLLPNRTKMPCLGFGTWRTPDGQTAASCVKEAIDRGYRHIDTAAVYGNETGVGAGIKDSGIKREELFLTTKHWVSNRGYEKTVLACEESLKKLGTDYVDLYLIHWPCVEKVSENWAEINYDTWRGFEKLYKDGKVKAIGVSNFLPHHLDPLLKNCQVKPMVNQIELHPGYMQPETVSFCKANGIVLQAWSPLGSGAVLKDERLLKIAKKYNKSVAQLCIRFLLQQGLVALPKTVTMERISQNAKVFDFNISAEDIKAILSLPQIGYSGLGPDDAPAG